MSNAPLMPMATAVWLVENTTLTFKQIAGFCKLHEVEIQGIADGEVAKGIKAYNPIISGQLSREQLSTAPQHQVFALIYISELGLQRDCLNVPCCTEVCVTRVAGLLVAGRAVGPSEKFPAARPDMLACHQGDALQHQTGRVRITRQDAYESHRTWFHL